MNSIGLGIIGMGSTDWQHLRVAAAMPQVRVAAVADTLAEQLADPGTGRHFIKPAEERVFRAAAFARPAGRHPSSARHLPPASPD